MGITPDEYAKRVREMILIQETIKRNVDYKIKVTEEDCKKFYEDNRSKFALPNNAGQRTYAQAKGDIEAYLRNMQGRQVANSYLKELRETTKVEILLPEPAPPTP